MKRQLPGLGCALLTAASVSFSTAVVALDEVSEANPFVDDAEISGGIYNMTRVRDRKDTPDGDFEENIHHSTALANMEVKSGLMGGWFGIDMGVFGAYDLWDSGSSQYSEFSLVDSTGAIDNGFSVYKANARAEFGDLTARAGYIQPSGPGVLGVNWSFVPGTYEGAELNYDNGSLQLASFYATEYKSPWTYTMDEMTRNDGSEMGYIYSLGGSYAMDNGLSVLGGFGQGEDYVDLYKLKLAFDRDDVSVAAHFYGVNDHEDGGDADSNDLYDDTAYQLALTSSFKVSSWTFRAEATQTSAAGNKGAFVFRPTYQSGDSNGSYEIWWDSRSDFNHDGETAVFGGAWYDFSELGMPGWSAGFSTAYGWGAESQDTSITEESLEEIAFNFDIGYTFQSGQLKDASIALHATYFDLLTDVYYEDPRPNVGGDDSTGSYTDAFPNAFQDEMDFKLMFMMPLSL